MSVRDVTLDYLVEQKVNSDKQAKLERTPSLYVNFARATAVTI